MLNIGSGLITTVDCFFEAVLICVSHRQVNINGYAGQLSQ